jgi:hypothetical protein
MVRYTKKILTAMGTRELKDLCRKVHVKGYSKYNKVRLIEHMLEPENKRSLNAYEKSKKPSSKKPASPKLKSKSESRSNRKGCHAVKGCSTKKASGYSAEQIRDLAEECGVPMINPATGKKYKRGGLCKEIAKALKGAPCPVFPGPALPQSAIWGPRVACKNSGGKLYKTKAGCNKYGVKKGCKWDGDKNECYKGGLVPGVMIEEDVVVEDVVVEDVVVEDGVVVEDVVVEDVVVEDVVVEDGVVVEDVVAEDVVVEDVVVEDGVVVEDVVAEDVVVEDVVVEDGVAEDVMVAPVASAGRVTCKNSSGKSYKTKHGCNKYGAKKGCKWDDTVKECYNGGPPPRDDDILPPGEEEPCYGGTRLELTKQEEDSLRALLNKAGVKTGLPGSKAGLVDYLCAIKDASRCDPDAEEFCEGENVCDEGSGLCLPPTVAASTGLETREWNGRKIMGSGAALDKLWAKLAPGSPRPGPPLVLKPKVGPSSPTPPTLVKPAPGTPVVSIEDILRKLEEGEKPDVKDMTAVQKEVLTCLGLLSPA